MATSGSITIVQNLFITYYGRPGDKPGIEYWAGQLDNSNNGMVGVVDSFATSAESNALYENTLSTADRIVALFQNIFNRQPDSGGLIYYTNEVDSGRITIPNLAVNIIYGAQGSDKITLDNKLAAANLFTGNVATKVDGYQGNSATAVARSFLRTISSDTENSSIGQDSLNAWTNTTMVASKAPEKFNQLVQYGVLAQGSIVSDSLTVENIDQRISEMPPLPSSNEFSIFVHPMSDSGLSQSDNISKSKNPTIEVNLKGGFAKEGDVVKIFDSQVLLSEKTITTTDLTVGKVLVSANFTGSDGVKSIEATIVKKDGGAPIQSKKIDYTLDTKSIGIFKTGKALIYDPNFKQYGGGYSLQNDGKILFAGSKILTNSNAGIASSLSLARMNEDGTVDSSFGVNGTVSISFDNVKEIMPMGATPLIDGKTLVSGLAYSSSGKYSVVLAKTNSDGTLDQSFAKDGKLSFDLNGFTSRIVIKQSSDGKIYVTTNSSSYGATTFERVETMQSFNPDGTPNTSFGVNGKLIYKPMQGMEDVTSLAIQGDGKILIGASVTIGGVSKMIVTRMNKDGSMDLSYGNKGMSIIENGGGAFSNLAQLTLLKDSSLIVAGETFNAGSGFDIVMSRLTTDGLLDKTFGDRGYKVIDFDHGGNFVKNVTVDQEGKILVSVHSYDSPGASKTFDMIRLKSDGSIDTSFNFTNDSVNEGSFHFVRPDGKVIVAGLGFGMDKTKGPNYFAAQLNPDGSLDKTFGTFYSQGLFIDVNRNGVADANDVLRFFFSETVGNKTQISQFFETSRIYGAGNTPAKTEWSEGNKVLSVILGQGEQYEAGSNIALTGVQDIAGNAVDMVFNLI